MNYQNLMKITFEENMFEVENINAVNKGSLLATCDVHILPWKMTLHEVKIFEKGTNRWIGMPAREYVSDTNEKKYIDLITWDNEGVKTRFRNQIMTAIDKYLEGNPDLKPEDVVKEEDAFPF